MKNLSLTLFLTMSAALPLTAADAAVSKDVVDQCTEDSSQTTARMQWDTLVAENFRRRPAIIGSLAVDYWEYVDGLPNVFLYGDSISLGYTSTVRRELAGVANVIRLPANGDHSGRIVEKMESMRAAMSDRRLCDPWHFQWDIIHFNVGLHDLKYVVDGKLDKESGVQVNSIDTYADNLHDAVRYFRSIAPDAVLIFATTTPVPDGEPGRYSGDAIRYNEAALRVMAEEGVGVNDLYAFTFPNLSQWIVAPGNVHYTDAASQKQGIEVARVLKDALATRPDAITVD